MSVANSFVTHRRSEITVGQKIWARMLLDPSLAIQHSGKTMSSTARKILRGKEVSKMGYVVRVQDDSLLVAYATTFGSDETSEPTMTLPEEVKNKDKYYPVAPATSDWFTPLPAQASGEGEWIYLGTPIMITADTVKVLEGCELSANSLQLVLDKIEWEKTSAT